MTKEEHKQEVIKHLKLIQTSVQNTLDAFYADQLEYKNAEDSMNYIRFCTQNVQFHIKNCIEIPCEIKDSMIEFMNGSLERIRRQLKNQ